MPRNLQLTSWDRRFLRQSHIANDPPTAEELAAELVRDMYRIDREAEQYAQKEAMRLSVMALTQELERSYAIARNWRVRCEVAGALVLVMVLILAAAVQWWMRSN